MSQWRIKVSLFACFMIFAVLMTSVGAVILQVQTHYGVSESAAGILGACRDVSIAVAAFLLAAHVARIGYKRSMLVSLGVVTVLCAVVPSVNTFLMAKLVLVIAGVCFALMKVAVYSTVGVIATGKRQHASLLSFLEASYATATFAGFFIFGGFAGSALASSTDWLRVYYYLAGAALIAWVLLRGTLLDESAAHREPLKPAWTEFTFMFRLAATAMVGVFVGSIITYDILEQSIMSWLPTFNSKVLHLPIALSIQMASIWAGSAAVGRVLAGLALRKFNWLPVLITCLLIAGSLITLSLLFADVTGKGPVTGWGNAPLAAFLVPLVGMVVGPIYPVVNSVVLSSLEPHMHGAMSGLIMVCSAIGGTAGAVVTGVIFRFYGGTTAFYWTLVPMVALILWLLGLSRLQRKSTLATPVANSRDGKNAAGNSAAFTNTSATEPGTLG